MLFHSLSTVDEVSHRAACIFTDVRMKSVRVCGGCHLRVTVAAADGGVDSHTLATVLPLDP